ncbi:Hypothetical predicted protein [Mytilus galloprovincialis]|uniref:Protein FMC1 homolog n=2 Tax=Mytilus TaxID=6548 RepID=A0A8B6E3K9_MYTGA|nr:Hypothetical predicted protein [Mytilus galloprovincialis]
MTSPTATAQLFRSLLKELRFINSKRNITECPTYQFMLEQFKNHKVTSEKYCQGKHDVVHVADTYLCLLESTRKHQELTEMYGGKGERSIEASANIVGLKLPKTYDPNNS